MNEKTRADWSKSQSTSENARPAKPSNGHRPIGLLARFRRVPRFAWLALSAVVLLVATLAWGVRLRSADEYLWFSQSPGFLTTEWWREVPVRGADSTLPEISGRLYGVAVQAETTTAKPDTRVSSEPRRLWIVGAKGLLAYSRDEGRCWTFYEYDDQRGTFHQPKTNPCERKTEDVALHWPDIVPTVLAAPQAQSAGKPQQQQQQVQQQPLQKQEAQYPNAPAVRTKEQSAGQTQANQSTAAEKTEVRVFPTAINFEDVTLAPPGVKSNPYFQAFTVSNRTPESVHVSLSGFRGDGNAEFWVETQDCSGRSLPPDKECRVGIAFLPKTEGPKQVTLEVQNSWSGQAVTVKISAVVNPGAAAAKGKPGASEQAPPTKPGGVSSANSASSSLASKPPLAGGQVMPPPSDAPDLLAVDADPPSETIVSTGGAEWKFTKSGVWGFQPMPNPSRVRVAGMDWLLTAPSPGGFATETRVENAAKLSQWIEGYPCTDCTMRAEIASTADAWAVGWSTDNSGDHAVIVQSVDGGKTWQPITRGALPPDRRSLAATGRPWRWMPRWYLALLILSLVLAAPALLPPQQVAPTNAAEAQNGSVEGRLSSDKPLAPGEHDVLGLTSIALGLSRFLRNEKTLPPLTVAINGEWGSGKSSLMNLLFCDLKSYGMYPVWFNAWHHQKEEHLLAALLQTVRLEAVPPLWNLLGVPFRVRLLSYRFRRRWPLLVVIAAALIFLVVLDYRVRVDEHTDLFLWLTGQILPSLKPKPSEGVSPVPVQGGILALVTAIGVLWKGLTAFGANPASLLASVAQGNKMKDLEAQTSFRQKFAVEFRDFTRALGTRRPLTIFIDDLDRCLPSNVRDVLEAVNFLVSSGDCFVVLGMDRLQVQRAVGLSFKKVAEEAGVQPGMKAENGSPVQSTDGADEISREKRAEFAQRYLEKLINLEVRVPQAVDDATKQRLFERAPEPVPVSLRERMLQRGMKMLQWAVPMALAALLIVGGYKTSVTLAPAVEHSMKETLMPPSTQPGKATPSATGAAATALTSPSASSTKNSHGATTGRKAEATFGELVSPFAGPPPSFEQPRDVLPPRWVLSIPFYLAGIFLLLVTNVVLTTRPGVVTKDSAQFTDAMEQVWYPLVLAKQNTPRAAKRFVNRVRYLAMRQRAFSEDASMWERVLFPQRLREPAGEHEWKPIPEPLLVAMAAMEQMEPIWIYSASAFRRLAGNDGEGPSEPLTSPGGVPEAVSLLQIARSKHRRVFSDPRYVSAHANWESLSDYRTTFLAIWPRTEPTEPD